MTKSYVPRGPRMPLSRVGRWSLELDWSLWLGPWGFLMIELFDQIVRRADAGESLAVCTLVRTRGSTPQKAGAVMVVLRDGRTLGTIGGGCVEAEVRTRALRLLDDPLGARLLTFKLDHDYGWDDGLVCGGVMDVAVQVIASAAGAGNFRRARDELSAGRGVTVPVTATDEAGKQAIFEPAFGPNPTLGIARARHGGGGPAGGAREKGLARAPRGGPPRPPAR